MKSVYNVHVLMYLMAMARPQRPAGLDKKLSQTNMGLNYPLEYVKTYV